jgi:hypothetical protein
MDDAIDRLHTPSRCRPPRGLLSECNAALEACLELLRVRGDGDDLLSAVADDVERLHRRLNEADGADVPVILRQIRRVLGRLDVSSVRLPLGRLG